MTSGTFVVAVIGKGVAVHHRLYPACAAQDAERERAVVGRLHQVARRIVYVMAIHTEAGSLHGDARTLVHHVAREAVAISDDEVGQRLVVALAIECHGHGATLQLDVVCADGRHVVGDALPSVVRQLVGHEVAVVVGGDDSGPPFVGLGGHLHLDAGHAGAVVHAHIAADAAGVLAGTLHHVGLAGVQTLAVGHSHHLIFILQERRHGGVLVAHLVYAGGDGLAPVGGALHATIDAEVIDHASVHGPR